MQLFVALLLSVLSAILALTNANDTQFWNASPDYALESAPTTYTNKDNAEWNSFKKEFNKKYKNAEEEQERKRNFFIRKNHIYDHNTYHYQGKKTFHSGVNEHSDMSYDEMRNKMNGLKLGETQIKFEYDYPTYPEYPDYPNPPGPSPDYPNPPGPSPDYPNPPGPSPDYPNPPGTIS